MISDGLLVGTACLYTDFNETFKALALQSALPILNSVDSGACKSYEHAQTHSHTLWHAYKIPIIDLFHLSEGL